MKSNTMEQKPRVSIAQRLAIEKQLLREEKYIVHALKSVKEERYALQREGTDLLCLLKEVLRQGQPRYGQTREDIQEEEDSQTKLLQTTSFDTPQVDVMTINSFMSSDFNFPLDEVVSSDVELNLTVPSHKYYGENYQMPEEEFEEMDTEDDFEIEMCMLMNSERKATD